MWGFWHDCDVGDDASDSDDEEVLKWGCGRGTDCDCDSDSDAGFCAGDDDAGDSHDGDSDDSDSDDGDSDDGDSHDEEVRVWAWDSALILTGLWVMCWKPCHC